MSYSRFWMIWVIACALVCGVFLAWYGKGFAITTAVIMLVMSFFANLAYRADDAYRKYGSMRE